MKQPVSIQAAREPVLATISSVNRGFLQRKCACGQHMGSNGECEACKKKRLQRKATNPIAPATAPPIVLDVLRSPGQPLDSATRAFMETRFRRDFSQVRVHTDGKAAESARTVNSLAYTVGRDVVFGAEQYSPGTDTGKHLLAHELSHVVQQASFAYSLMPPVLTKGSNSFEVEAERASQDLVKDPNTPVRVRPHASTIGTLQRFSTAEHEEIGNRAYEAAKPQNQATQSSEQPLPLSDLFFVRPRATNEDAETIAQMTYGQLVAVADNITSFLALEERERERAQTRVPVLSSIWDWIGDSAHYVDLAARNIQHFHPHNWRAWQRWHWAALNQMNQAYQLGQEAIGIKTELNTLLQRFDQHYQRARASLIHTDNLSDTDTEARQQELENITEQETEIMNRLLTTIKEKVVEYRNSKEQSKKQALRAIAINGFGDHFLTDAFAAGHIVTPREELLNEYATNLFGYFEVGGVLQCANIPSLAWHDLDNKFGVWVDNREGDRWLAFGDNFANRDENETTMPLAESRSPTLRNVVKATSRSMQQIWATAAGNMPTDLSPILDLIPRPDLSSGKYPNWKPNPAQAWDRQLRYAAGEAVGDRYDPGMGGSRHESRPREEVPNPEGEQIGSGLLSARATCWNVTDTFNYQQFVVPMINRLRRDHERRYYSGRADQIEPSTAIPVVQESVEGNTILGSILGGVGLGLAGTGIGFLVGGPIGALIGGLVGLIGGFLAGGFIGGLIGEERDGRPAV